MRLCRTVVRRLQRRFDQRSGEIKDSTVSVNGQVLSNRIYFTRVSDKDGEQPSKVVTDFTVSDPAKKYGIQVWKVDKELDKSETIGGKDHKISETGTTLEGVQFSIINRSATAIKYGDKTVNPGEEVTKITTSWNSNLKNIQLRLMREHYLMVHMVFRKFQAVRVTK